MEAGRPLFADLLNMENPQSVFEEVENITVMMFPKFDFKQIANVYKDVIKFFKGQYPGYRDCNIFYHDLKHTTDTLLAIIRLIHGAAVRGETFSEENVRLGLISALLHDAGYIQREDDTSGTGAKHTLVHIQRSIEFMDKYFAQNGFSRDDFESCRDIILCTGLNTNINSIKFKSHEIELLGKMMGSADLLGQMADQTYLEKLLYLYYEFKEGNVGDYVSELDLLKSTLGFYKPIKVRFLNEFSNVNRYMSYHFKKRWNIDEDLYEEAIEKNMDYLKHILQNHENEYRSFLRRGGVVRNLEEKGVMA